MILVVDHDPEVLEKAQEVLNRTRQVFLASTAKKALEMVHLGFAVALVDLDLPGDAMILIRRLHDTYPDLLIIATSGGTTASLLEGVKDHGVVEVLTKPITSAWKPVVERIRERHRFD